MTTTATRDLPLDQLHVDPANPRRHVDPDDLADLVASIRTEGILDRLEVRPTGDARYGVLSGQRRMLAAREAGLDAVPCEIHHDLDDSSALVLALAGHTGQRQLLPSEEGAALKAMVDAGRSQRDVAQAVGCSQARVSNLIKLLDIDEDLRAKVDAGQMGIERALATVRRRYDTSHSKPRGRAAQEARERGPVAAAHLAKHTAAQLLGVSRGDIRQMISDGDLEVDPVSGGIPLHEIRRVLHAEGGTPRNGALAGPRHEYRRVPTAAWKHIMRWAADHDTTTDELLHRVARGLRGRP